MLILMHCFFTANLVATWGALCIAASDLPLPAAEAEQPTSANIRASGEGFDRTVPGQLPTGWTVGITGAGTPNWSVVGDASAPSVPNVLQQSGEVPKGSFPLCLRDNGAPQQDGFVEVKFKAVRGKIDQAAGLVWRAQGATNYYVCRANALEDNVVLYRVENGQRKALDIAGRTGGYGVNTRVTPSEWHRLRVEFDGPRFRVFFDGKFLFEVVDATFPDAGKVGLWTKADSVTLFDDFTCGAKQVARPVSRRP
jgi:hypothetical protein